MKWLTNKIQKIVDNATWEAKKNWERLNLLSVPLQCCKGCGGLFSSATMYEKTVVMTVPHFEMKEYYCLRCSGAKPEDLPRVKARFPNE